jgi:hypothetical protein
VGGPVSPHARDSTACLVPAHASSMIHRAGDVLVLRFNICKLEGKALGLQWQKKRLFIIIIGRNG